MKPFRVFGHPLHAMVSDFPMVLLLVWFGLDGSAMLMGLPELWAVGRWALVAGLVSAMIAALTGMIDSLAIDQADRAAHRTFNAHLTLMLLSVSFALVGWLFRTATLPEGLHRVVHACALGFTAGCLTAGGWFGGHLVFHHGVGRDQ